MRTIFFYLSLVILPISCKEVVAEDAMMAIAVDSVAVADTDEVIESALLPPPPKESYDKKMDAPAPIEKEDIQPKIIKTGQDTCGLKQPILKNLFRPLKKL